MKPLITVEKGSVVDSILEARTQTLGLTGEAKRLDRNHQLMGMRLEVGDQVRIAQCTEIDNCRVGDVGVVDDLTAPGTLFSQPTIRITAPPERKGSIVEIPFTSYLEFAEEKGIAA